MNSTPPAAPGRRPYTFDRVVRLVLSALGVIGAIWLIDILSSVLLPFVVAWLIAYLLEPLVQYNRKLLRVRRRVLPVMITLFECVLLLSAVSVFVVPSVLNEMHHLAGAVTTYSVEHNNVSQIPAEIQDYIRENIDFVAISKQLTGQDWRSLLSTVGSFIAGGYDVVMGVFSWFVVLLYIVFIMLDYERLLLGFRHLVPPRYRNVTFGILDDVTRSMNHYFRGQALVASIVGVLFAIGFLIIGMPMAIVLGLFIGLLNMVPYLQLISLVPATLLCLVWSVDGGRSFWNLWFSAMAVYIVVQCIQDLFLTPKIMGHAMGLNPALILLSLSIWGTLMGFIGLIIALPLTTLLLAYYDRYITRSENGEPPAEKKDRDKALRKIVESPDDSLIK